LIVSAEVVIEGSDAPDGPWKEFHFLYKPGDLSIAPTFCLPHQPRLDWQMWFAALGTYQHNPWFVSLVYRDGIHQYFYNFSIFFLSFF
jgi:hypothetical protein